jgi:hypothetical protein
MIRPTRIVGHFREPPVYLEAFRWLDNVSEIRRLFARSAQVTCNLQERLPSRGADRIGLSSEAALHGWLSRFPLNI